MKIARDNRGQATVMTVIFLTVLCGMAALVLDVGSWYRADRALQAEADAAALAGAQALPDSTGDAALLATQYADKNGGGLDASGISFDGKVVANDTIKVQLTQPAPGFFAKILGVDTVTVAAHAAARSDSAGAAKYVAPIVVNWKHSALTSCNPSPCKYPTEIDLLDLHKPGRGDAAGSFGLINLDRTDSSSVGSGDLAAWITKGFDAYLPLGNYDAVPSSKFNSSQIIDALTLRKNTVLLFPIYQTITGPGDNAVYKIIGWVGFYVTGWDISGSSSAIYGHFTRRISEGLQVTSAGEVPDEGVRVIQLVD